MSDRRKSKRLMKVLDNVKHGKVIDRANLAVEDINDGNSYSKINIVDGKSSVTKEKANSCMTKVNAEEIAENVESRHGDSSVSIPELATRGQSSKSGAKSHHTHSDRSLEEKIRLQEKLNRLLDQQEKKDEAREKERLEREVKLLQMKLQLNRISRSQLSDSTGKSELSSITEEDHISKVRTWLADQENPQETEGQNEDKVRMKFDPLKDLAEAVHTLADAFKFNGTSSAMETYLKRKGVSKDLPDFTGNPEQWPLFISQYRESTKLCEFSDAENLVRLQRCIKGNARDVVQALLVSPENVSDIINCLELNFGKPQHIIMTLIDRACQIRSCSLDNFMTFSNIVINMVTTIKNMHLLNYLDNPVLLRELTSKLPTILKLKWGEYIIKNEVSNANLDHLAHWCKETASVICETGIVDFKKEDNSKKKEYYRKTVLNTNAEDHGRKNCIVCNNGDHNILSCKDFKKLSIEDRWKKSKNLRLCFCCLKSAHSISKCRSKKNCGVNDCKRQHHFLLHKDENSESKVRKAVAEVRPLGRQEDTENINTHREEKCEVLLRIAPVKLIGLRNEVTVFALFDEASTVTLLEEDLADRLGVTGPVESICFQWTNEVTRTEEESRKVNIDISGVYPGSKMFRMLNVRTVKNLALPQQSCDIEELKKKHLFLKDYPVVSYNNAKPSILIGQDNCDLTVSRKVIHGQERFPILSKTWLGWVMHGKIYHKYNHRRDTDFNIHMCYSNNENNVLERMIRDSFRIEALGMQVKHTQVRSQEDSKAEEIMQNTVKRIGNCFEIGLLWKDQNIVLPDSKPNALRRLRCIERKMDRDKNFADEYVAKIDDYILKGYAVKVSQEEIAEDNPRIWYLPHFAVLNDNKPGKIRLVMDAAAKVGYVSINDVLLTGPDLLSSLLGILWNFRRKRIAFSADIKEMFHQVIIRKEDRVAQRFLWRGMERNIEPQVYEMRAMIFGSVCSPSIAQFIKNTNAKEFEKTFPKACKAIQHRHYVDDYLDCADTEDEAIELVKDVIEVHKRGGFEICNWISSSQRVLEEIPENSRSKNWKNLENINEQITERVLGMHWNPKEDIFTFVLKLNKIEETLLDSESLPTKRQILKTVMSVFDPCGLLSNIMIKAKILLQEIWRSGVGWDDEITGTLNKKWKKWLSLVKHIPEISIPRCYFPISFSAVQLHIFCDASEKAYGVASYIRTAVGNQFESTLIGSKTRVTPLKPITIPRLELQAALLASRMGKCIQDELEVKISSIFYWTDSKTVLQWINSDARRYKAFVAHRIGEILELTDVTCWRWVPTKENVADDVSRDDVEVSFSAHSRWFKGPEFLKYDESYWPKNIFRNKENISDVELKEKTAILLLETTSHGDALIDIDRFSKYNRLIRATAWAFRFINNCRDKVQKIGEELNPEEINMAELYWLKLIQMETFPYEVKCLQKGVTVPKSSKIFQLCPYLDDNGILRINGRISKASDIDEFVKNPIILDSKSKFSYLLVLHHHNKFLHSGTNMIINEIRQKFWIINIRSLVKKVGFTCQICRRNKSKPMCQIMGQLPKSRVTSFIQPFTYTGIDYFGPITVTIGRRNEKRYGVIFTCLTIRAIHIEIANNLTSDSAIMAIRRFVARRGSVKAIYSDNGTNLRGAEKEIKEGIRNFDQNKFKSTMTMLNIQWHFNPPCAPHMGGCWERLVRTVKTALKLCLKERHPKEETLQTAIAEVESIVNNRPLTDISVDPKDPVCLTPNDLLIYKYNHPPPFDINEKVCLRKQWQMAQQIADNFWRRWLKEYMPTLVKRQKWFREEDDIKLEDVVLIVDEDMPRSKWLLGRVTAIYPGSDKRVRVVDVVTKEGVFRRPIVKLCKLDIS